MSVQGGPLDPWDTTVHTVAMDLRSRAETLGRAQDLLREALQAAANGLKRVSEKHGADSLGFVSSSRCTGEENYLMQKLSRAAFGTNNIHQCAAT